MNNYWHSLILILLAVSEIEVALQDDVSFKLSDIVNPVNINAILPIITELFLKYISSLLFPF